MSLKLDGKKLSLEIEGRLNDYISNNKKIAKYKTIGDKTGSNDGIIISFIAATVNKSTSFA